MALVALSAPVTTALAQPAAPAGAAPPDATASALLTESDPAVRAALELPRETPADYFQAIIWLIDLERPELAKPILDELTKLPLTDAQRAELVTQFGSRDMLRLAQSKPLAPAGGEFARASIEAAAAIANDPQRLAALVAQLTDPSPEARLIARNDLAATGIGGVVATLEALASEADPANREALAHAAEHMQPLVARPLLAMLDTSDPALHDIVAGMLRNLSVSQAVPLLAELPDAEPALRRALDRYRRGMRPFALDENGQIELWNWDDAAKKLSSARFPADEARVIWMVRLAKRLAQLMPWDFAAARHAMLLELEAAVLLGNSKSWAYDQLNVVGTGVLNQILEKALAGGYSHAAIATANALGKRAHANVLFSADGRPAPLAEALESADRRVRFAALRAIMAIDPAEPYPGSSRVPKALSWFAAGSGERRALVAMRTAHAATELAGLLPDADLQATPVDNGREAVDAALQTPDLEMIFVDTSINDPGIRQVIYELRISPTTAEIPIAILAPPIRLEDAEKIAAEHERVVAVPRIHTPEVLNRVVARLTAMSGRFATPPKMRAAEATEALTWISKLASRHRPFYKLRRSEPVVEGALYSAATGEAAIAALARLSSPEAQRALVDYASQLTLPISSRSQAAEAFRQNVALHGVLLTSDEIMTQYDRYNASENLDTATQHVLGSLLDVIESRPTALPDADLPLPPQP